MLRHPVPIATFNGPSEEYLNEASGERKAQGTMTEHGNFIEIQGTAEKDTFEQSALDQMLTLAKEGIMNQGKYI